MTKHIPNAVDSNTLDFGNHKIGTISNATFSITNTGTLPIHITQESLFMSHNANFTVGKSILPFTILPDESKNITIHYAPTSTIQTTPGVKKIDIDTLLVNACSDVYVILKGTPTNDTIDIIGKCEIPIRMIADSIDFHSYIPQISPNPIANNNDLFFSFAVKFNDIIVINIYDANGRIVREIMNTYLSEGIYEIPIQIDNMVEGAYFVELKNSLEKQSTKFLITK